MQILHLQDFGFQVLIKAVGTGLRDLPYADELKECGSLPFNRISLANFFFEKIFQELEVGDEATTQYAQQLEEKENFGLLVQLEVLEQDFDDDLRLFPVREVDAAALSILFVVALLVPDCFQRVDECML